jgi:hypothetical protein
MTLVIEIVIIIFTMFAFGYFFKDETGKISKNLYFDFIITLLVGTSLIAGFFLIMPAITFMTTINSAIIGLFIFVLTLAWCIFTLFVGGAFLMAAMGNFNRIVMSWFKRS